jgi:hypothetical protein
VQLNLAGYCPTLAVWMLVHFVRAMVPTLRLWSAKQMMGAAAAKANAGKVDVETTGRPRTW